MSNRSHPRSIVQYPANDEPRAVGRRRRAAQMQDRSLEGRTSGRSIALLVRAPADTGGFVARPGHAGVRLLARLRAPGLDRRLARGDPPEATRLMAARAQMLVSRPMRRSLIQNWRDLSDRVAGGPSVRLSAVPLCRDRIIAAERQIRAMVQALSTSLPVPVRGVAMASWLLTDGAGPLYNRDCTTDLPAVLGQVIEFLDPTSALNPG